MSIGNRLRIERFKNFCHKIPKRLNYTFLPLGNLIELLKWILFFQVEGLSNIFTKLTFHFFMFLKINQFFFNSISGLINPKRLEFRFQKHEIYIVFFLPIISFIKPRENVYFLQTPTFVFNDAGGKWRTKFLMKHNLTFFANLHSFYFFF